MARFSASGRVLFVDGSHNIKTYELKSVLINLSAVWDIKFMNVMNYQGTEWYEMIVYYTNLDLERRMMITEKEFLEIKELIGG